MIYTDLTKKAMKICIRAHRDQVDRSGLPYLIHPFHVAEQMTDEYSTCTALLHDVIEDSDMTPDELRREGMPEEVVEAVVLLTHSRSVPYLDYIAALKHNEMARIVKLADLEHNCDMGRFDVITRRDIERLEKYKKAKALLEA